LIECWERKDSRGDDCKEEKGVQKKGGMEIKVRKG
jgi:hypothetical protein